MKSEEEARGETLSRLRREQARKKEAKAQRQAERFVERFRAQRTRS